MIFIKDNKLPEGSVDFFSNYHNNIRGVGVNKKKCMGEGGVARFRF
jgi:hypothetical protein